MTVNVTYYYASSTDGYIAREDGSVDWLEPFQNPGQDYGYAGFFENVDALVMGRKTYEQILEFGDWPYGSTPCWVVSKHLSDADVPTVKTGNFTPRDLVHEMEAAGIRHAWLVGGAQLASAFEAEGLISTYCITMVPVVLGSGMTPLFRAAACPMLRLESSHTFEDGVVQLSYVPARDQ
jgi:dihydrofolate reductase